MTTIEDLYSIYLQHPEISTDSRNCPDGCMFFALKGDNFNANAFALSAINNGASVAVVDDKQYAVDERFVFVDNVLNTLQNLALYHRKQLKTIVLGITGTNGKTTTKELIASVLSQKYNILFTKGNLNNHIGVPLTLLKMKPHNEIAVIEMGANHPGEIKFLSEIACPDYGIITNVGKAHLEGFGSFEGVKSTKSELYNYILTNGKMIFVNSGNENLVEMYHKSGFTIGYKICEYSLSDTTLIKGKIVSCSPFLEMSCFTGNDDFVIKTNLIGTYNAENVLAAVTIGHYFDISDEQIKSGLESYVPQNNRSQLTVTGKNKLVVDAYNANPTSMRAAIINFAQMDVPNKMLILGDMLELGEQSSDEHQAIVDLLESFNFSSVYLVGKLFSETRNTFNCFQNVESLLQFIEHGNVENCFVLIKGSRGIKLEKVLSYL